MSYKIDNWSKCSIDEESKLAQFQEIFFVSSSKQNFSSEDAKQAFFKDWTELYFLKAKEDIYLAYEGNKIFGYLTGYRDSNEAKQYFPKDSPYGLFADLFDEYNCHLHINCHPDARGKGVGTALIEHFKTELKKDAHTTHKGIHIITAPDARNVNFYKKVGFNFHEQRMWKTHPLLFMGLSL